MSINTTIFNRKDENDIKTAKNIFKTISDEMGFKCAPVNTFILRWEPFDANRDPLAFGYMAEPKGPIDYKGVVMLFNENHISLSVIDIRCISRGLDEKFYYITTDLSNLEKELKIIFSQYCNC